MTDLSLVSLDNLVEELANRTEGGVIATVMPSNSKRKEFFTYLDFDNIIAVGGLLNILNARYQEHLADCIYSDKEDREED